MFLQLLLIIANLTSASFVQSESPAPHFSQDLKKLNVSIKGAISNFGERLFFVDVLH